MSDTPSQFIYLLNAFEEASRARHPAKDGYAEKRQKLLRYVERLELSSAFRRGQGEMQKRAMEAFAGRDSYVARRIAALPILDSGGGEVTPKQRVLKKHPSAYAQEGSLGWYIFGRYRSMVLAYGRTPTLAWADAARRLK